jgi:nucleotide-binding universal stress UspA family protein
MSIVMGYDDSPGSGRALDTALSVAKRFDEKLVLVYGAAPPGRAGEEFHAHLEALEEYGRAAVAHAVERADREGVRTEVAVVRAKPAEALVAVAERHDASMIVVGSTGEGPLRGALLGSTPHRLLHLSSTPVLVVPVTDPAG